ncbi:protein Dok-7 isoform X2 [Sinocyclocheilus anshuiensis]|uniref:protein Dok-7 isoform X2 n=1 Tax=Sinocyclocheilus anshuiensis TaxID=1608454 RepID=UPI0007BA66C7|nr:PREDICTED: protein Dok-7-like isoform X2 [Sinocyclocheilus anshuiensis]
MSDTVIAEGAVKLRDGRKWRSRWLVLRKPSPVADCLVLCVYKERGVKESSVTLEHICGLEACVGGDGVPFILSILCLSQSAVLGFDSREALQSWDLWLRYCLGEVHSFSVSVLPGTKLESGPATLHLCNNVLVIAKDLPAVIRGHWNLLDLRRYGPVNNGFVFEGGTRCGYWAGVFFLSCAEAEQISFLFDCIVRGISPSRGPFGLKPLLREPSISAASAQDRLKHEVEELERRLSLLSHSTASAQDRLKHEVEELERRLSLLSHSTASSSRFGSSLAGDDRSISGSSDTSDTSQSDCSISGRPAPWSDLVLPDSAETSQVEEKLQVPANPVRSRKLKESGRQNSSDSGIATGSFSSYSGSLDAAGPGEEYGVLFNLPEKHLCSCSSCPVHEYQVPSSLRFLYDSPRSLLELSRHSSTSQDEPCAESPSQSDSELDKGEESHTREGLIKGEESQGLSCSKSCCSLPPAGMKSLFTSCLVCGGLKGSFHHSLPAAPVPGEHSATPTADVTELPANQEPVEIRHSSSTNHDPRRPSSERSQTNEEKRSEIYDCLLSHYSPAARSSVYEAMAASRHTVLYENCVQCRRGEDSCRILRPTPPSRDAFVQELRRNISESSCSSTVSLQRIPAEDNRERIWAEKGRTYEIMDSRSSDRSPEEERSRYQLLTASQKISPPLTEALTDRLRGDAVTYVNIPTSPTSKKLLHYMELELQESSAAVRGKSSSKYAQIDITAMEEAHRAGSQHALGREEGLQRLEQQRRRRGLPHDEERSTLLWTN